jgi:hypothetical protein
MSPVKLSDDELSAVMSAAQPLPVACRVAFLQSVANAGLCRARPRRRASDLRRATAGVFSIRRISGTETACRSIGNPASPPL